MVKVPVVKQILTANDRVAEQNRAQLDAAGIYGLNLMASPGAGKTTFILASIERFPTEIRPAVIEGDLASSIDAEKIASRGIPVVQINTGGNCHLDAPMIGVALPDLPLDGINLLFVENVGNLVCTANFALGTHMNVVIASVPEGHDKPYKYPGMFAAADVVILNKADLLPVFDFDLDNFRAGIAMLSDAPIFPVSSRSGAGITAWVEWLIARKLM